MSRLAEAARFLLEIEFEVVTGDPFTDAGAEVDVEVALPPLGMRVEASAIMPRTLGYLAAKEGNFRLSAEVVAVADAVLRARRQAIICCSEGVLFRTVGAETLLRGELVRKRQVEAVLALPSGAAFRDTMIRAAVMVVDPTHTSGRGAVRMVDVGDDRFSGELSRGRRQLKLSPSWRGILAGDEGEAVRDVSYSEIEDNNAILTVDRYLQAEGVTALNAFLDRVGTAELASVIELVRPKALRRDEAGEYAAYEASPGDFGPNGFLQRPARRIPLDESAYRAARQQQVRPGDVLLSVKGTIGAVALVPDDVPDMDQPEIWTAGQSIMILRPKRSGGMGAVPLYAFLAHPLMREFLQAFAGGTTIPALNVKDLRALRIPMLEHAEQHRLEAKFAETLERYARIAKLQQEIDAVRAGFFTELPSDIATV